ncbi:MAG TPA: thioredoxin [Flavobacteriales bacterium]|nr:thioredoxin [Flavobacteriales bacterium]
MSTFTEHLQGSKPVVVDFHATWCGPCKAMKPILEEFKHLVGDRATVLKVDVDRNPNAARTYNVQGVPTIVILHNGIIVWRRSGVVPAKELMQALEPYW